MKKVMTVVAVIAVVAVVASPASAYHGMGRGYDGGCGGCATMGAARGLDLTADQSQKIGALREARLKEIKPLRDQIFAKKGDLRLLWLAKTPDKEKIIALQKEVQNLRGQMMEKATTFRLEARNVLTPEQLAKDQSFQGMGPHRASGGPAGMRGGHAPFCGMR